MADQHRRGWVRGTRGQGRRQGRRLADQAACMQPRDAPTAMLHWTHVPNFSIQSSTDPCSQFANCLEPGTQLDPQKMHTCMAVSTPCRMAPRPPPRRRPPPPPRSADTRGCLRRTASTAACRRTCGTHRGLAVQLWREECRCFGTVVEGGMQVFRHSSGVRKASVPVQL